MTAARDPAAPYRRPGHGLSLATGRTRNHIHPETDCGTRAFEPVGALSEDELAAESSTAIRRWDVKEIAEYRGAELFGPQNLAAALRALVVEGVPDHPLPMGP
ncbi:hypothetical protein SCWH03_47290 [Streptomyces pacificus]|uniref:Uncharacterized protein n=1 Tax=Streptomyces pacificus TaxID=2705029 RepID=A0A6A0B3V4_9ACTN|nr:hypothetical protein SCWH03_47290 [Streptomyces pacificus]